MYRRCGDWRRDQHWWEGASARRSTLAETWKIRSILRVNILLYCFYSSVLKRVLSVVEHHGGGEKTTGKKRACVCALTCLDDGQRVNVKWQIIYYDPQNTGFEWDNLMHAYLRSTYNKWAHKPKMFTHLYLKDAYFFISPSLIITSFQ